MNKLYIRHGKFFRDGVEERPEIGNVEQIDCLRKHERFMETMKEGVSIEAEADIDEEYVWVVWFKCFCGNYLHKKIGISDHKTEIDLFDGTYLFCKICSQRYKITKRINSHFRELIIKTD